MAQYVQWTVTGLTDPEQTSEVPYYEMGTLNATAEAQWVTDDGGNPPVITGQELLLVNISCRLYGMNYENGQKTAKMQGIIEDAFVRNLDYLVDNPEPLNRTYGEADRISALPEQKLFLYGYYKEQTAKKQVPVTLTAVHPITREVKGTAEYYVTVINTYNDGEVVQQILADHAEWRPPFV